MKQRTKNMNIACRCPSTGGGYTKPVGVSFVARDGFSQLIFSYEGWEVKTHFSIALALIEDAVANNDRELVLPLQAPNASRLDWRLMAQVEGFVEMLNAKGCFSLHDQAMASLS